MEVCRDVASALAKLHQVINDDKKLETKMKTGLRGILLDMGQLNAYIEQSSKGREQGPAHEAWILQLQDLAYDIEDFVDSLYRKPKDKFPLRAVRMITATDPRPVYGDEITGFQERTAKLETSKPSFPACTGQNGAAAQVASSVLTAGRPSMSSPNGSTRTPSTSRLPSSDHGTSALVGIDRFKQGLVDLLKQVEGEPRELRVISILGVRGVGKTALARAIYEARDTFGDQEPFDCHAMVMVRPDDNVASGSNGAAELLREILLQVSNVAGQISDTSAAELQEILKQKRYLIVIDGLQQREGWDFLKEVFPQNERGSRIVVSTSVQLVAKYCSSSTSFVYKLEGLDDEEANILFWQEVGVPDATDSLKQLAQGICHGCHGLPLAVLSAAKYLRPIWRELGQSDWDREARALGNRVIGQGEQAAFAELKRVLVECFDGLTGHRLKTCLLSVTMFPRGHPIKRKSLFRRWIAEGFVEHDGRLDKNAACHDLFRELVELHLVESAESSRENLVPAAQVKMCQVHGVLLDFLLSESLRRNFTDLIRNNVPVQAAAGGIRTRRLAVHTDKGCRGAPCDVDLTRYSYIRSLTIVNSAFKDLLESQFLRVLDLERSKGIDEQALCKIFQLIHLKYLSIRGTDCCRIPKRIRRLHRLETLDARDSNVRELPIEVLLLPRLAHLFGEFRLPSELCSKKKVAIASKDAERVFKSSNSKLESVAGFLVDDRQGFQHIMLHMHNLKKVKMRWGSTSTAPTQDLSGLLAGSLRRRFGLECLTVDFGAHSLDFMNLLSYSETCMLKSIKLHGSLSKGLPDFIYKLNYLSELHLFSTGLDSEALSVLQQLDHLEHLQLEEVTHKFGGCTFIVAAGKFERLNRLIIHAPKLPHVTIANGAMAILTTLELLCHDVTGFAATGISRLGSLSEVVLLKSLKDCDPDTCSRWEAEAKKHKKRPRISFCDGSKRQQRQAAAGTRQKSGSVWRMLPR